MTRSTFLVAIAVLPIALLATACTPEVTDVSPQYGIVGQEVVIQGTGFGLLQAGSVVLFNGVAAGPASYWSDGSITVAIPAGATTGPLRVMVLGQPSNPWDFVVSRSPLSVAPVMKVQATALFGVEGGSLSSPRLGDHDGDGILDILFAQKRSDGSADLAVLYGLGDGTFGNEREFPQPEPLEKPVIADFNGDGVLDVAAKRLRRIYGQNRIYLLRGVGFGGFVYRWSFPVNVGEVLQLVPGDFDGDERMDLAVLQENDFSLPAEVAVYLGNGDGTLGPVTGPYAVGIHPNERVGVGDLNEDGCTDLVVSVRDTPVGAFYGLSVLISNGDGTFATAMEYEAGSDTRDVVVEDLNQDGHEDVAVRPAIFLGDGTGALVEQKTLSGIGYNGRLYTTDHNGDGVPDLGDGERIALGDGAGGVHVYEERFPEAKYGYTDIGDVNGDGIPDRVDVASNEGINVVLGDGGGGFGSARFYEVGRAPNEIAAADFNRDGWPDTAVVLFEDDEVGILLNDGSGAFEEPTTVPVGRRPTSIVAEDFDRDGNPDIAIANQDDRDLTVLFGDGTGGVGSQISLPMEGKPDHLITEDFTGDGVPDLAASHSGAAFSIFAGDGIGGFSLLGTYGTSSSTGEHLATGHLNGDARLDILVAGTADKIFFFAGDSDQGFVFDGEADFRRYIYPARAAVGDFNEDGHADFTLSFRWLDAMMVFLGGTATGFSWPEEFWVGEPQEFIVAGDINTDGHEDLLLTSKALDSLIVFLGDGTGSFEGPRGFRCYYNPSSLVVEDFNRDGKPDAAVANLGSFPTGQGGNVQLFYGDGQGGFVDFN